MTPAQLERLRKVADGSAQGSSLDRAWRALAQQGYVRTLGRGEQTYTAVYEITADGRAVLEAHAVAEAAT